MNWLPASLHQIEYMVYFTDGGLKVDCRPIIDWLCFALTLNTGDKKSPLAMLRPNRPLEF